MIYPFSVQIMRIGNFFFLETRTGIEVIKQETHFFSVVLV